MLLVLSVFLEYISLFLDFAGLFLVLYGALLAVYRIIFTELKLRGKNRFHEYENAKRVFIQKMIFGLDFFVAGDILKLIDTPSLDELYVIAGIVIVRTILSHFLSKEIHLHKER